MKATKYLAMAVMALTFAACSNDELASVAQKNANGLKPVEFTTVVKNQTRAPAYNPDPQITSDNLALFYMESTGTFYAADGTPVTNPKFTVQKDNSSWIYKVNDAETASTLYWPLEGTDATFSAWSYTGASYDKEGLDNSYANRDAVGAYTALSYTGSGDGPVVNLDFKHAVSKVEFKAKVLDKSDASPLNVKVFVRAICIKNVAYAASSYTASTSTTTMGAFNNTADKRDIIKVINLTDPDDDDWLTATTDGDPSTDGRQAKALGSQTKVFVMPQTIAAVEDFSTSTWSKPYISVLARICIDGGDADGTIIFPKGSGSNHHAWIALPLPADFTGFQAHKNYIFTLNFRNDALGLVDRDQNPNDDEDPCGPDATDEIGGETPGGPVHVPDHSGFPLNVTVTEVLDFEEGGDVDVNLPTASAPTSYTLAESTVGMIVGTDGNAYNVADKDNLPTGVTAVAMVAYKNGSNGLAIQLNASPSLMEYGAASSYTGYPEVSGGIATWRLPSKDDWQNMFVGCAKSGDAEKSNYMDPIAGFKEKIAATGIEFNSNGYWSPDGSNTWAVDVYLDDTNATASFSSTFGYYTKYVLGCLAF